MGLKSKDLLGMKQLTADEIMEILDTAKTMKLVISSANKQEQDFHSSLLRSTWDLLLQTSQLQEAQ